MAPAKECFYLRGLREHGFQIDLRGYDTNSPPSSTHEGLDNNGIIAFVGRISNPLSSMLDGGKGLFRSRDNGNLGRYGHVPGSGLVTEVIEIFHGRTHKGDTIFSQRLGKVLILRQEPVAGVDRLDTVLDTNIDDRINVQVLSYGRLAVVQLEGLIRLVPVLSESV
jgi:hypothetical protein